MRAVVALHSLAVLARQETETIPNMLRKPKALKT